MLAKPTENNSHEGPERQEEPVGRPEIQGGREPVYIVAEGWERVQLTGKAGWTLCLAAKCRLGLRPRAEGKRVLPKRSTRDGGGCL